MSIVMSKYVDWHDPDTGRERLLPAVLIPAGLYVGNPMTSNGRHFVVGPFKLLSEVDTYLHETTGFCNGEYITTVTKQTMVLKAVDGCEVALNLLLNGLTGIDADKDTAIEALASLLHEDAIPAADAWEAIQRGQDFTVEGLL